MWSRTALANQYLGLAYGAQGDYRRAIDCFGQTRRVSRTGARRHARFGRVYPARCGLPCLARSCAMPSWACIRRGPGPRGTKGCALPRRSRTPQACMFASWGVGLLALRQGDLPRALPLLERAVGICQDADLPVFFPRMAAALGAAYTLDGRVADAVPLLTQAMEQTIAMETVESIRRSVVSALGEAQVLAGRLEEAHALAERALAHRP